MQDYKLKLKAFLHEPIQKGTDFFNYLFQEGSQDEVVNNADIIASGFGTALVSMAPEMNKDKNEYENEDSVFFKEAKYIDFLKGDLQEIGVAGNNEEVKSIFEKLGKLSFENQDEKAKFCFLFLWRFLPEIFPWINKYPADFRVPNHSIYDHLVQTSTIASCIKDNNNPSFLLFTIGPVQEFIAKAKKTSDLWAGSFLLSYLTYTAIEVIMEELGPDHIIFPNLIKQPLVDKWLYERLKNKDIDIIAFKEWKNNWKKQIEENNDKPFDDDLTIANIPNRFLAIVPSKEAKTLAEKCKEKVYKKIEELALKIENIDIKIKEKIKDQVNSYFNCYYAILPWGLDNQDEKTKITTIIENYKNLILNDKSLEVIEFINNNAKNDKNNTNNNTKIEKNNIGITYSLLVSLTERFLAARKNIRDFVNIPPQEGKKCKICGEYSSIIKDKEDNICGVCYLKRRLPDIIKQELSLKDKIRYPSTSDLPTVKYKSDIDEETAKRLIENLKKLKSNILYESISVPSLKGKPLYNVDGVFLVKDTYRKDYFKKEYEIEIDEGQLRDLKKILNDNKINPPVYYAILAMDGDEMGKWLNGEKMLPIENLIHPKSKEELLKIYKNDENKLKKLNKILSSPHPMNPSFHNSFSRKLSDFSLNNVKRIVENYSEKDKKNNFFGKLIYAGGDDVLAFLPVETALNCADKLQETFKSILSDRTTMSAGIVFVHHKYPLSLALEEVRKAEKAAKNVYDRNSCCIRLIKNSGQIRQVGFHWDKNEKNSQQYFFESIIEKYKEESISSKFAYDFMSIVRELEDNNNSKTKDILKRELERIYFHKLKKENRDNEFFNLMISIFESWKQSYEEFANMFIIARFIANLGRE